MLGYIFSITNNKKNHKRWKEGVANNKDVHRAYLNDLEDGFPRWRQHTTRFASVSGSLASCTNHEFLKH